MTPEPSKRIHSLLQREMTRKQFLTAMFGILLSVIGLPAILSLLTQNSSESTPPARPGYGRSGYGP
jgi:hypothetical protein